MAKLLGHHSGRAWAGWTGEHKHSLFSSWQQSRRKLKNNYMKKSVLASQEQLNVIFVVNVILKMSLPVFMACLGVSVEVVQVHRDN